MTRQNRTGGKAPDDDRQHWQTPPRVRKWITEHFRPDLDAAADAGNTLAPLWMGPGSNVDIVDALAAPWPDFLVGQEGDRWAIRLRIFINPPFSSALRFVERAIEAHQAYGTLVLMLLPISTDTQWFARLVDAGATVTAITGRVCYDPPPGVQAQRAAELDEWRRAFDAWKENPVDDARPHLMRPAPKRPRHNNGAGFPSAFYSLGWSPLATTGAVRVPFFRLPRGTL
jgi:phage N-6-adenine-methyltransferase